MIGSRISMRTSVRTSPQTNMVSDLGVSVEYALNFFLLFCENQGHQLDPCMILFFRNDLYMILSLSEGRVGFHAWCSIGGDFSKYILPIWVVAY